MKAVKTHTQNGVCDVTHTVTFDLTPEEEREYRNACELLADAGRKAMREAGTTRKNGDFTSVTSKVHKGQLLVFVHQGMIG
jgi:hypothetical protein